MNMSGLICPVTKQPLTTYGAHYVTTADGRISYPIKSEIPILLGPEAVTEQSPWPRNVHSPQYDEAYSEMEFYNKTGYEHAKEIRDTGTLDNSDSAGLRHLGPIVDRHVDACYVGGCVHHMRTEVAFSEMARILAPGGKFAAIEPWRAPGYSLGTKIFGKREPNAFCSPLDKGRLSPIYRAFSNAGYVQHGSLTRYPSIVAQNAGIVLSVPQAAWVADVEHAICNGIPFARKLGSGVALLATK